jgi:hypothetical protein
MANDIAFAPTNGLATRDDLVRSLSNAVANMPASGGDVQYLKMEKTGTWVFGQEETPVEKSSLWAINPQSFTHGYVAWDTDAGGAPVKEVMVPVSQPLPASSSLPPLPASARTGKALEYKEQRAVQLVCVLDPGAKGSDTDEGTLVEYKQSSVGAMKLFRGVADAILQRAMSGSDQLVPIVRLTNSDYKHAQYGKIFNPVFDIVEWRSMNDATKPGAADAPEETDDLLDEYNAAAEAEAPRRRARRD